MSLLSPLIVQALADRLQKNNPHLSRKSARYLAKLIYPIAVSEKDPVKGAEVANAILLDRVRRGDSEAVSAVREDLEKFRPAYETAVAEGRDPVLALALTFPLGEVVARQHVEMFKIIDGK